MYCGDERSNNSAGLRLLRTHGPAYAVRGCAGDMTQEQDDAVRGMV